MGKKPGGCRPGSSSTRAGRSARSPKPEASARARSVSGWHGPATSVPRRSGVGLHPGPRGGCLPSHWPACPRCCIAVRPPTAVAENSGPAVGARPLSVWNVVFPLTRVMWVACSKRSAGARNSRRGAPANATKPPLRAGARIPGRPSKGGAGPGAEDLLRRRIRLLSSPQRRPDRCARGPDAYFAGVVHP
jgi:hypothetical protein